jgi:hypothetical protein
VLTSWDPYQHHDLMDSIYTLYPLRKKDAFNISQVDLQIFRGVMYHSTNLSLDLSNRLLAAQREIRYLRTRQVDIEDIVHAHQMMHARQDNDIYSSD